MKTVKTKTVQSFCVPSVPKNTNAKNSTWLFALLLFLASLLLVSIPAYPRTFDCNAFKYNAKIESVNNYIDYTYTEAGLNFKWHIELIDSPSISLDWLLVSDPKTNYNMLYPANCKEL